MICSRQGCELPALPTLSQCVKHSTHFQIQQAMRELHSKAFPLDAISEALGWPKGSGSVEEIVQEIRKLRASSLE